MVFRLPAVPYWEKLTEHADVSFVSEAGDEWVDYFTRSAQRPVGGLISRQLSSVEVGTSEVVVPHKRVHDGVSSIVVPNGGKVAGIVTRLGLYAIIMGIASG